MRVCKHGCDVTLSVFPEKYVIKAIEDFLLAVFTQPHLNTWGGGGEVLEFA